MDTILAGIVGKSEANIFSMHIFMFYHDTKMSHLPEKESGLCLREKQIRDKLGSSLIIVFEKYNQPLTK